jgi:hypothetical protein
MNMQVRFRLLEELETPSRVRPRTGDLYAYRIGHQYRFIRIVGERPMRDEDSCTAYFYRNSSEKPDQVPHLCKEDLLIPPVALWSGEFQKGFTKKVLSAFDAHPDSYAHHEFTWLLRHQYDQLLCAREAEEANEGRTKPTPCYHTGFLPEIAIGLETGDVPSQQFYKSMSWNPRPLYRASMKGKLPHSDLNICLLNWEEELVPNLIKRFANKENNPDSKEFSASGWAMLWLFHQGWRMSRLSRFARQSEVPFRFPAQDQNDVYTTTAIIKGRQFEGFFEGVADWMKALGIAHWWIEDAYLDDWLAGTYKPADHKTL